MENINHAAAIKAMVADYLSTPRLSMAAIRFSYYNFHSRSRHNNTGSHQYYEFIEVGEKITLQAILPENYLFAPPFFTPSAERITYIGGASSGSFKTGIHSLFTTLNKRPFIKEVGDEEITSRFAKFYGRVNDFGVIGYDPVSTHFPGHTSFLWASMECQNFHQPAVYRASTPEQEEQRKKDLEHLFETTKWLREKIGFISGISYDRMTPREYERQVMNSPMATDQPEPEVPKNRMLTVGELLKRNNIPMPEPGAYDSPYDGNKLHTMNFWALEDAITAAHMNESELFKTVKPALMYGRRKGAVLTSTLFPKPRRSGAAFAAKQMHKFRQMNKWYNTLHIPKRRKSKRTKPHQIKKLLESWLN